jgi:hypothetical protein
MSPTFRKDEFTCFADSSRSFPVLPFLEKKGEDGCRYKPMKGFSILDLSPGEVKTSYSLAVENVSKKFFSFALFCTIL